MSKNLVSASLVVLTLAVWLGSGYFGDGQPDNGDQAGVIPTEAAPVEACDLSADIEDNRVRVSMITAQPRTRHVVLNGRTDSKRMVNVAAGDRFVADYGPHGKIEVSFTGKESKE